MSRTPYPSTLFLSTPTTTTTTNSSTTPSTRLDSFAGEGGNLVDDLTDWRPSVVVTQSALLTAGFELHADLDRLHTDLCRVVAPERSAARTLPLLSPSVEQFGGVAGWRLREAPAVEVVGSGEGDGDGDGDGDGGVIGAAPSHSQLGETCALRDRNAYAPYRWMFSGLTARAEALDDRFEEVRGAIAARARISTDAVTFGRICAEADSSRVNVASVSLDCEGSKGRLSLDFREVLKFAVFPGQIVGVRGAAVGADRLMVTAVTTDGRPPHVLVPVGNATALSTVRSQGGPVRAWVAAGPFSESGKVDFTPLLELVNEATNGIDYPLPDVLVLSGPFIDADNVRVKSTAGAGRAGVPTYRIMFQEREDAMIE